MKWSNVRLILGREVRDQLRDRRTLFMIAILPLLLYPLIGMTFLQVTQFLKEHPSRIYVIGADGLPASPPLLQNDPGRIVASLFYDSADVDLIELTLATDEPLAGTDPAESARQALEEEGFDAVVHFPLGFGQQLKRFCESVGDGQLAAEEDTRDAPVEVPRPQVYFNTAKDKSRVAHDRLVTVLNRWREQIVDQTLAEHEVSARVTAPFTVAASDVSVSAGRRAAVWSKVLPFILLIWALTGAFYPAIDLCAGEKERGTLETLLSSPAERSEIVWGKLLTVMLFSMATSLLNLISMCFTAGFITRQLSGLGPMYRGLELGPPPIYAIGWLILALIPLSALFSALSLALATMARSTKEGQYYLMPLMLVTLPLLVLPILPAAELDLGSSLIPVTGVILLLRSLMEGEHAEVVLYAVPVVMVTLGCCLLAIRWAIDQFNNEFVLFRESERLDLGLWLIHLVRDRGNTPSVAEAIMCGMLLLLIRFFAGLLIPMPVTWNDFAVTTAVTLIALIAAPALLMTVMLTRRPRLTLLLNRPPARSVVAAVLLAVFIHPISLALTEFVRYLYPINEEALAPLQRLVEQAPSVWYILVLLALMPAICEELAFRGFILSGLRHVGSKWKAIVISSVFFGLAHPILQQSLMATVAGIILGYIAVQTGSVLPCMVFHFVNNSLALFSSRLTETIAESAPQWHWTIVQIGQRHIYDWPVVLLSIVFAVLLLAWFRALPFQPSSEERLQEAMEQQPVREGACLSHVRVS